jgi:cell division protein FtsQ
MAKRQSEKMSRAEKVRAQRQQSRKKPQTPPFGNNVTRKSTNNQVPVTRRTSSNIPVINRPHRKVNVPLKTRGAELQLPAFPRFNLGWRLISGAIFFLSLAIVFSFSSLSTFEISAIDLRGAQRLGAETILNQIDLVGNSIISVKPDDIELQLSENFPSLKSISVSLRLPASVTVNVIERQPLVLWQQEGNPLWIDSEGVMFPIRGKADVLLTVIANSEPPEILQAEKIESDSEADEPSLLEKPLFPRTTPEFVAGIQSLSAYVPDGSLLQYDPRYGMGWQDPNGWLVYFGKETTEVDTKLAGYETILLALQKQSVTPAIISLEFLHAPFYRLEQ